MLLRNFLSIRRRFATKPGSKQENQQSDVRSELMRKMMYETPSVEPDIGSELDEMQVEVIETAYQHFAEGQITMAAEGRRQRFQRMKTALDVLEVLDKELYDGAVWKEPAVLFPKAMKVWTETPPPLKK